jgi:hypothetical protein
MPLSKASRADASCASIQLPFFFFFDPLLTLDPTAAGWDAVATREDILENGIAFSSGHVAALAPGMPSMEGLLPPSPIASLLDLLRREEVGIGLSHKGPSPLDSSHAPPPSTCGRAL